MNIHSTQPTQTGVFKKAAATVATAAVAAGTAMYLAKSGKLDRFVGKNAKVDTAINGLKGAADKVTGKIAETCIKVKMTNAFQTVKNEAKKAGNFAADKFGKLTEGVRTQLGKFNSDLAPMKAKMAETFNNFVK